jgi:hypothetical protein
MDSPFVNELCLTLQLGTLPESSTLVSNNPEARAKQASAQRQHAKAQSSWIPSSEPVWLTAEVYSEKIQPLLAGVSSSAIASRIGVSRWYAGRIREGYRPHPRHWQGLAELVDIGAGA